MRRTYSELSFSTRRRGERGDDAERTTNRSSPRFLRGLRVSALRITPLFIVAASLFAAEPADAIWSARYVITQDAQRRVIQNGAMAIRGERIVGVGTRAEIDAKFQAKQRLDRPDAILAPGLINTHTHAAMSLFRGIADDLRLQDWLEKFI